MRPQKPDSSLETILDLLCSGFIGEHMEFVRRHR
jgi:hypothetical protein